MTKVDTKNLTDSIKLSEKYSFIANHYSSHYNDVISKLCHEIKNPLTLISSTIQLMEVKYPEIKNYKYWDQLAIDVRDCIELLDSFKQYRNCIDVRLSNNNLLELIETVSNSFQPIAEKQKVELKLYVDEDVKQHYINYPIDKVRLQQALVNIIKNSMEAVDQGNYVHIRCKADDSNLIIEIIDNGKLISDDIKDKIFNLRVTKKPTGSGLGLPLSRSIIRSHMGDIEVKTVDKETRIIIYLPKIIK
ncbi:MAG: HAMP domain-containing histidine kinase [Clostridiales bacterium]|nr:HAMP domain-containing histidine kinase [Clostridiales bacterium]